jgi:Ca-activated chloride channel homolog
MVSVEVWMPWRLLLVTVALLVSAEINRPSAVQQRPTFTAQSDLVVVHAMVEDRRGAAVPGLAEANFLVYEDNRPQTISFFSSADAPATIGLLIDNSTSMASKRERVIASVVSFAELSNPEDEIFVLAFNENVLEAWAPRVINESDIQDLGATLQQQIAARGKTALYDAIAGGLDRLSRARHTRQVLVIISDGSDNASRIEMDAMLARALSSGAMVYTVALSDPVDRTDNPKLLKRISTMTGGESFSPRTIADVPEVVEHIARDIRATYTLGYVPSNQARDGTTRKLRVVARHPDGRTLKVQTRGGYVAPKSVTGTVMEGRSAR